MRTIVIIGGGASGMTAAITAAVDSGNHVVLLEKQPRVGKKLLATGNGCCNLSNANLSVDNYFGADKGFVMPAFKLFGINSTIEYFKSLGLLTKIEDSGKIYPYSLQASSVLDVLRFALERAKVEIKCDTPVLSIERKGTGFNVNTDKGIIFADKLIVAAGGAAAPKLGGTMDGYKLLQSMGHTRTALYPSLVQVKTENAYPRALKGIKTDANVTLLSGESRVCESYGEVLFTEYGLSGPAIFEISRFVSTEKDLTVSLDLMPEYKENEILEMLLETVKTIGELNCEYFLAGMLNKRLGQMIIKYSGIAMTACASSLKYTVIKNLSHNIKNFRLPVTGNTGFENAQVTAGGIRTNEFLSDTLESRLCPNLFAAGEVLDIDGRCGGYNLQWAWSSGRLAGMLGKL